MSKFEYLKLADTVAAEIATITGLPFVTAPNKFEALGAQRAASSSAVTCPAVTVRVTPFSTSELP